MGALLVTAWPGTVLLLAGMGIGRLVDQAVSAASSPISRSSRSWAR